MHYMIHYYIAYERIGQSSKVVFWYTMYNIVVLNGTFSRDHNSIEIFLRLKLNLDFSHYWNYVVI